MRFQLDTDKNPMARFIGKEAEFGKRFDSDGIEVSQQHTRVNMCPQNTQRKHKGNQSYHIRCGPYIFNMLHKTCVEYNSTDK